MGLEEVEEGLGEVRGDLFGTCFLVERCWPT
jgi:hypothetical protein